MAQTDNQNSLLPEGNGISDGSVMKRRGRKEQQAPRLNQKVH